MRNPRNLFLRGSGQCDRKKVTSEIFGTRFLGSTSFSLEHSIFDNTTLMHFNIQYVNVAVEGDCGWVTCYERISSVLQGRASNFGILATNIFIRTLSGWRMTAHHASPGM